MVRKLWSLMAAVLLSLSLVGSVMADEMKGKITKVGEGGRSITVQAKDKEVTVNISASRTALEGVSDRSGLKEGQSVTVEYSGSEAKKVSVTGK